MQQVGAKAHQELDLLHIILISSSWCVFATFKFQNVLFLKDVPNVFLVHYCFKDFVRFFHSEVLYDEEHDLVP